MTIAHISDYIEQPPLKYRYPIDTYEQALSLLKGKNAKNNKCPMHLGCYLSEVDEAIALFFEGEPIMYWTVDNAVIFPDEVIMDMNVRQLKRINYYMLTGVSIVKDNGVWCAKNESGVYPI